MLDPVRERLRRDSRASAPALLARPASASCRAAAARGRRRPRRARRPAGLVRRAPLRPRARAGRAADEETPQHGDHRRRAVLKPCYGAYLTARCLACASRAACDGECDRACKLCELALVVRVGRWAVRATRTVSAIEHAHDPPITAEAPLLRRRSSSTVSTMRHRRMSIGRCGCDRVNRPFVRLDHRRPEVAIGSGYTVAPRGCGGIGRRARFRSVCPSGRGGSSPLIRIARPCVARIGAAP